MNQISEHAQRHPRRRTIRRESPRQRSILARLRSARQRIGRLRASSAEMAESEYAFLVGRAIDAATLGRAERIAQAWAVLPHEVMIARLKPGKTVDDVRRWNGKRDEHAPFVYIGGITPMSSGMTVQTQLVLQTGTHVILCPMKDAHARSHDHERGVIATFTVS